jgi:hypothetical protein
VDEYWGRVLMRDGEWGGKEGGIFDSLYILYHRFGLMFLKEIVGEEFFWLYCYFGIFYWEYNIKLII